MSEPTRTRTLELAGSEKNANYGKAGGFNALKRVVFQEWQDGTVTMSFYSQKKEHPGQILKFSAEDFRQYQNFVFPVVESFKGLHGVEQGIKTPKVSYGLDAQNHAVVVLPKTDESIRIKWEEILKWAGSKVKLPKNNGKTKNSETEG
jgi:hypothetical protein